MDLLTGISLGEAPFAPGLATKLLEEFVRRDNERDVLDALNQKMATLLSPRQIQILQLVAQGLTYKEVAERLQLTEATIKYHMGEILNQLHLQNRSQAVAFVTETGLIRGKTPENLE